MKEYRVESFKEDLERYDNWADGDLFFMVYGFRIEVFNKDHEDKLKLLNEIIKGNEPYFTFDPENEHDYIDKVNCIRCNSLIDIDYKRVTHYCNTCLLKYSFKTVKSTGISIFKLIRGDLIIKKERENKLKNI